MNEQMLNKLEYIIFVDENFKKAVIGSSENKEEIIPQLLQERGVELNYPQFRAGIIKIFRRSQSNKNNVLSDELSDDELDIVVGGDNSSCYNMCVDLIYDHQHCTAICCS